jgi:YHS domain-containing protein
MPIDPVCGMVVPEEHAAVCTDFKGKHFCFCSEECKEEFDMDPEMYSQEGEVSLEEEEAF